MQKDNQDTQYERGQRDYLKGRYRGSDDDHAYREGYHSHHDFHHVM